MLPYGVDKATQTVKNIQDKLTYTPRTEAGQQGAQAVGEFVVADGFATKIRQPEHLVRLLQKLCIVHARELSRPPER